jgi:hypothetical protein
MIRSVRYLAVLICISVTTTLSAPAQDAAANGKFTVPHLIRFNGVLTGATGKPVTGTIGITFSLYKEEQGGAALWIESQNVTLDPQGHYSVMLGTGKSNGVPPELFASNEARWLGVQPEGQIERPRTLLLSVPYALKAGDAETIGGLPPSAFVLAAPPVVSGSQSSTTTTTNAPPPASNVTTAGGTVNTIPLFSTATDIENSAITQTGSGSTAKIGIGTTTPSSTLDVKGGVSVRGTLVMNASGSATAASGKASQPENMIASSFNSSTSSPVNQTFQLKAEPSGNNTANPSGTLNLLFGQGTSAPTETGLKIANNGQITFASGQTFPGTGNGTITGVTAGAGLSGGGSSGSVSLSVPSAAITNAMLQHSVVTVNPGTDLTGGGSVSLGGSTTLNVDTTKVPQLSAANNFTANQTVTGNITATGTITGSTVNATTGYSMNGTLFAFGNSALGNALLGFAGNSTMTGNTNTGVGAGALTANTSGSTNTAVGNGALNRNTTGSGNNAIGLSALLRNTTGSSNVGDGLEALFSNTTGGGNTGVGVLTLFFNTTGSGNTAVGNNALPNTDGATNETAIGNEAGQTLSFENEFGTNNTFLGAMTSPGTQLSLTNATAVGALAEVDASNSMILGSINGVNSATADTNVGIGTTAPTATFDVEGNAPSGSGPTILLKNKAPIQSGSVGNFIDLRFAPDGGSSVANPNAIIRVQEDGNSQYGAFISFATMADGGAGSGAIEHMRIAANGFVGIGIGAPSHIFQVGQNAGAAFADSWSTYSSRRWKTNIQTLDSALDKVQRLRGVSYNLKDTGKPEIGVIAEEVGQVVPEIVSYEANGTDAQGVDYSRLTALLIEAVKQQQKQIRQEQKQIRLQQAQIQQQQKQLGIQQKRVSAQQSQIDHLRARNAAFEARLAKVEAPNQRDLVIASVSMPEPRH